MSNLDWRPKMSGNEIKAYAAGIIDGEGTITIRTQKDKSSKKGYRYQLVVEMGISNEWIPQWFKFNWGGGVYYREDPRNKNWKPQWRWMVMSRQAGQFLVEILPFLILKRGQAELGLKFQQGKDKHQHCLSDKRWATEEAEKLLISQMNKKGVGK